MNSISNRTVSPIPRCVPSAGTNSPMANAVRPISPLAENPIRGVGPIAPGG